MHLHKKIIASFWFHLDSNMADLTFCEKALDKTELENKVR